MRSTASLAWGFNFGRRDVAPPPDRPLNYAALPAFELHGVLHKSCAGCLALKPVSEMVGERCAKCSQGGDRVSDRARRILLDPPKVVYEKHSEPS